MLYLIGLFLAVENTSIAQGTITIDHKTQRFIGSESTFDRGKYLNAHIWFDGKKKDDPDFIKFKKEYNIEYDYKGSRRFWNPVGMVKNGKIPFVKDRFDGVREVTNDVATGTAKNLFYDKTVDYSTVDVSDFSKQISAFTAQSFKDSWPSVPMFFEPLNEPMVHAHDHYPGKRNKAKTDNIITKISEFHRDMGQAIHATPELKNMKLLGYGSAWPEFEKDDFSVWNSRYKKFIDIAGADVDIFSVHLYDGKGLNNTGGRRSGSNAEAILDMIEAYSFLKLGTVKPIAVTEYGRLVSDQPNWKPKSGISNYHPIENAQAVRSQIHMVMSFMERGDGIVTSIPFSTGKQHPTAKYSKAGLWTKDSNGNWELTSRKYFFEVWKDIKGERVRINSSNVDIQKLAVVDGKKLYVVLNNLNDETQELDLNLLEAKGLKSVELKRVKTFIDKAPELTLETLNEAPQKVRLVYGETVVLTYKFKSSVKFDNTIVSSKYYADTYLQNIEANKELSFSINDVETGHGEAILRIGLGRALNASLKPNVWLNDEPLNTDGDLIKGYNQHNRRQFFGTLEIPFDISLLKQGKNQLKVQFPDDGGQISSVILQVQKAKKPLTVL
ncbi:hypothetical protein [Sediminitomix flava]|nr:hypothetical protein [Sediminitomix flava]